MANSPSISPKQFEVLKFPYRNKFALICDGAIRSGKTVFCGISFILWAMSNFKGCNFGICGKTIASTKRNIIKPLITLAYLQQNFTMRYNEKETLLTITRGKTTNYFYVFGGKDESSYMLIQGITLAGVLLDEVALMPRSFVEQALARCSVKGSKALFNCNPEKPSHWFKTEWIDNADKKDAEYLHFTMNDNPSLSEEVKQRYRTMYSGVFYQRYIEGKWVTAEGSIYPMLADNEDAYLVDKIPDDEEIIGYYTGVDFGGNKSSTAFVTCAVTRGYKRFYFIESAKIDSSILNTDTLKNKFRDYIQFVTTKYNCFTMVYCDNAEPLHIRDLQVAQVENGLRCRVGNALKESIKYRIQAFNTLFTQYRIKILKHNKDLIQSFKDAVWDDKKEDDTRLDNGSYCVDLLDASEYSIERFIDVIYKTKI